MGHNLNPMLRWQSQNFLGTGAVSRASSHRATTENVVLIMADAEPIRSRGQLQNGGFAN